MAWIYLAELVALASHSNHMLEQSPIVNLTDTHRVFYCPECDLVTLIKPQYGTMCKLSGHRFFQKSTSFLAGSHAKTSALQGVAKAWKASEADFSTKLSGLQKKLMRRLCSLKTCQQLELEDFEKSSEYLPIWGMIVDGRVFLPEVLEPVTYAKDGSCLPTLTVQDAHGRDRQNQKNGTVTLSLLGRARLMLPTLCSRDWKGKTSNQRNSASLPDLMNGYLNPLFCEEIMGYQMAWTELDALVIRWFRCK